MTVTAARDHQIGDVSSDKNVIFDPDVSTTKHISTCLNIISWAFNINTINTQVQRTEQNATDVNKKN